MGVIWMRAAGLVRRGWRAGLVLAVLAGGVAMAVVAAGRRTATVYDRFLAYADVPELQANFCPPGLTVDSDEDLRQCFTYDAKAERDALVAQPEVEAASRGQFRGLTIAKTETPAQTWVATTLVLLDPGLGVEASVAATSSCTAGRPPTSESWW